MAARESKGESEMLLTAEQRRWIGKLVDDGGTNEELSDALALCVLNNDAVVERVKMLLLRVSSKPAHSDDDMAMQATDDGTERIEGWNSAMEAVRGELSALLSDIGGE